MSTDMDAEVKLREIREHLDSRLIDVPPRQKPAVSNGRSQPDSKQVNSEKTNGSPDAPESLRRPMPPPDPYPMEALGCVLEAAARRIRAVVQAPEAMCGQAVLAAASLAAQPHADVEIDGRRELLSLYVMTIGESGERKSGVDRIALSAHHEHERERLREHEGRIEAHTLEFAAYEAERRKIEKLKDRAEMRRTLEDLGPPPPAPLAPILIASTPTLEGLHRQYATGLPSLGLFHDDGGEFIGGHAMSSENRMKSASGLSRLWDTGEFDRVRAGDGAAKYYGRRLALHLMIQPVIAESVLSDDILTGQGLLARALLAWPTSTIGNRPYVAVDLAADPAITRYHRQIAVLLEREQTMRAGTRNELSPRCLALSPDARRVWIEVHDVIEQDQLDGAEWASIRPWASKAPAQILRIAGVQTIIEDPDAGVIGAEAIERAAMLMQYYLREAVRIVGTASVPAVIRHAEQLRDWCHRERITLLHSRAALQYGPGCIRTVDAFDDAIAVLERTGWARRVDRCEIDGAMRRKVWQITGVIA